MLKLRYDNTTGMVGSAYPETMAVPEPYLEITEEQNNLISQDTENVYFVDEDGELYTKAKLEVEQTEFWNKNFFHTSLGWVRREPTLADGSKDNFLNNNLPLFAYAIATGKTAVLPIAYSTPDFTQEFTPIYLESLQMKNQVITDTFIAECTAVKMADFTG